MAASFEGLYDDVRSYIVGSGNELKERARHVRALDGPKPFVTAWDHLIERELTRLIQLHCPDHLVYGEELNPSYREARNVWAVDPISSTESLIKGFPHWCIVATHLINGRPVYAIVYDPSTGDLFEARQGLGATRNGIRIGVALSSDTRNPRIVLLMSPDHVGTPRAARYWNELSRFDLVRPVGSFALAYCYVAAGLYDGVIALTKDAFPEFAGWLMLEEAGGGLWSTSGYGVAPDDRCFYGGNPTIATMLRSVIARVDGNHVFTERAS